MLLFAHVGITFGAAAAAAGLAGKGGPSPIRTWPARLSTWLDIRWLMVGAMLPDLIDKPLGLYVLPGLIGSGRVYAHTLMFLVLLTAAALLVFRRWHRTWLLALAAGTLAHLVLDELWSAPVVLFWPLLGAAFPLTDIGGWAGGLWHSLTTVASVYVPETIGFLVLAWFGVGLLRRRRLLAFLRRGAAD